MVRYHLHLHNAHIEASDDEGIEAADLEGAKAQALAGIRDFLGHELKNGRLDLRGQIDITSDTGEMLATVTFNDAVVIVSA